MSTKLPTQNTRLHSQPPNRAFVYVAAVFAALGGLLFGYDTGVISGAELFLKNDFTLTTFALEVIVSGVLAGAAAGALLGGRMADLFGRRRLLIVTAIIFGLGGLACAAATSTAMLDCRANRRRPGNRPGLRHRARLYFRSLARRRARLASFAFSTGHHRRHSARLCRGLRLCGHSGMALDVRPGRRARRHLRPGHGVPAGKPALARQARRDRRARAMLARIRGTSDIESKCAKSIRASSTPTTSAAASSDLFAPSLRPALIVGIGLAVFQQVTGINTVIYYAPLIIQSAGISSASGAILATAGIGVVNVLMTIVAMWLIDRMGRRPLLLIGIAGMVVTLGILGLAFHMAGRTGALAWLAVVSMMVYVASFAISLGPIFWLLISEIYPLKIRSSGEGLAAAFNWGSNLLVR